MKHTPFHLILAGIAAFFFVGCMEKDITTENIVDSTAANAFDQDGATHSVFSVAAGKIARFSKGNLQYNAAQGSHATSDGATKQGTWRFAQHQYDMVGDSNALISDTYDGWIDLFGWGTSGWNGGANAYQPWSTSTSYSDYYPGGDAEANLTDEYAEADWGMYNAIEGGGNAPGMWRTLAQHEWYYLINERHASTVNGVTDARYAKAVVAEVRGMILFPDSYTHPAEVAQPKEINSSWGDFTTNTYTAEEWDRLEAAGCVFLPAAGTRIGASVDGTGEVGEYWSASHRKNPIAYHVHIGQESVAPAESFIDRSQGSSVRLVRVTPCTPTYGDTTVTATESYTWHGHTYTHSGTYTRTLSNTMGCDSIVTLHLTIVYSPWVDLGLPSGLLWASCNLGANAPEEYGNYYAWGETSPKDSYSWSSYSHCTGTASSLTKYCNNSIYGESGFSDGLTTLEAVDDAATALLGNGARTPTKAEWEELLANTAIEWTSYNGEGGCRFTASNGNSIFLPAAGYFTGSDHRSAGNEVCCWSSSLATSNPANAWLFDVSEASADIGDLPRATYGLTIRAVRRN